jgi:hypothetical protein
VYPLTWYTVSRLPHGVVTPPALPRCLVTYPVTDIDATPRRLGADGTPVGRSQGTLTATSGDVGLTLSALAGDSSHAGRTIAPFQHAKRRMPRAHEVIASAVADDEEVV